MKRKPGRPKRIVSEATPQNQYGVNVAVPNTNNEKMQAIVNISKAIYELSIALNSVNTQVTVSNNVISNGQTGINIATR